MRKPRLLDLFCGAGGAAKGYQRAGFYVIGIDIAPQKHYCGDEFHQADALTYPLEGFDAIHASPPCQGYSAARHQIFAKTETYQLLLEPMRERLLASDIPWIMENVKGAPMGHYVELCATQFGLPMFRHRQFESSHLLWPPRACSHPRKLPPGYYTVFGKVIRTTRTKGKYANKHGAHLALEVMGIDWMTLSELSQAIPPAYTEWLGRQLFDVVCNLQGAA